MNHPSPRVPHGKMKGFGCEGDNYSELERSKIFHQIDKMFHLHAEHFGQAMDY